jgi:flagellar biosynthesis GTPase FlhF
MSHHFSMGAVNKQTLQYEYPKIASKENKYKCPSCDQDVILRKGKIKKSHYAHKKSENPCYYYDRPSESQIHKDAKMLMKMLLDKKTSMTFCRKCCYCDKEEPEYICDISHNENTKAVIEYRFHYNHSNRSADVALVDEDGNIIYIFEICYKNKTKEENRPEPWFEIDAESFIKYINENEENETEIVCKREYKCACCVFTEGVHRKAMLSQQDQTRVKEEEISNEKEEIYNMKKEDERTIRSEKQDKRVEEYNKTRRESNRKSREIEEEHKNAQRRKMEEEYKERQRVSEEEYKERQRVSEEECKEKRRILQKLSEQNNICSICNINFCKCDTPHFITDKNKRTACTHCKKRKCKCVRITNFFKNTLTR